MFGLKNIIKSIAGVGTNKFARELTNIANKINEASSEDLPAYFDEMAQTLAMRNNQASSQISDVSILVNLDDSTHAICQKINREFLLKNKEYAQSLPSVLKYWNELTRAYQLCQRQYQAQLGKKMLSADLKKASFLGLRHQINLIKWDALRHTKPNNEKWNSVFFLYQFAEEHGFHQEELASYKGRTPASCQTLMIRLGMLNFSQTDTLTRKEIEALEILLNSLFKDMVLSNKPFKTPFQYAFDLSSNMPPQKIIEVSDNPYYRYWNGEQILSQLGDILFNFDKGLAKKLTSTLPDLSEQNWYLLVEKLSSSWSQHGGKAMRKEERVITKEWCDLSIGLANSQTTSANAHYSKQVNPSCSIVDKSNSGFGLVYIGPYKQLLELNVILLISSNNIKNALAIVKRLQHLPDGGTVIGVQKLGENAVTIEINEVGSPITYHALFVPQLSSNNQTRFLLIAPELGVVGEKMLINNANQKFMISITQIVNEFIDCKQVSFDVIQQL
jgi:hypothetical protein